MNQNPYESPKGTDDKAAAGANAKLFRVILWTLAVLAVLYVIYELDQQLFILAR